AALVGGHRWVALVGTGGWHWWAQVGGTGGHRWVGTGGWHCWAHVGGTAEWHRWVHCWAQVGALLGTGGGTAGNGWVGGASLRTAGRNLRVSLLGTDHQGT
ncbi:unnamed protein product, partial [Staurois parvus]